MARKSLVSLFVVFQVMYSVNASAQIAALTVLSVKNALEDALNKFNTTIATAGNEARSTGASLSANAQNVVSDINSQLGGRLNNTISQLTDAQKQLANDAVLLTQKIEQSTKLIINKSGEEARRAIFEADITAYNTSYSLPCRDLVPRIVYSYPDYIRKGSDARKITIRGNFLDIGDNAPLKINGVVVQPASRNRNEIVFEFPEQLVDKLNKDTLLSILVPTSEQKQTSILLYCYSRASKYRDLSIPLSVKPEINYKIHGTISGNYDSPADWQQTFSYNKSDGDCGASYNDNQNYCAPAGYDLDPSKPPGLHVKSANCNSSVGSPQIAGNRCVTVPAHLGGCGYDNLIVAKNCKGRGWFDYDVTLHAYQNRTASNQTFNFDALSSDGKQRSFEAVHPDASLNLSNQHWSYTVNVEIREGDAVAENITASNGNPNPGGISTGINNGRVFINIEKQQ